MENMGNRQRVTLKISNVVDFRVTPIDVEDTYYFDFVDKNKELVRLEVSFKKGYVLLKDDKMNPSWLKEKQPLNLSKIYKEVMKPTERHNMRYF